MAEMVSIRHEQFRLGNHFILSLMAFDNLRTFEFDEIVNTMVGGVRFWKSTLITIL